MSTQSRIGVNGFDFRTWPYQRIGEFLQRLGVSYFELQYDMNNGQPLTDAAPILADYDISIPAIYTSSQWAINNAATVDKARAVIGECIELAEQIGAQFVQLYPGPILGQDQYTLMKLFARNLQPCLCQAETAGVTLMFENLFDIKGVDPHARDIVRRPESALALLETVGSEHFKLNFDPCNFYVAGAEPWPYSYEILKEWICYIHLKDAVFYSEYLYGPQTEHVVFDDPNGEFFVVPLGDGAVNYDSLLRALMQDSYNGPLIIEAVTLQDKLEASFARSIAYLQPRVATQ